MYVSTMCVPHLHIEQLASAVFCRYEQTFFQVHVQGNPGYFRYIIVKKY